LPFLAAALAAVSSFCNVIGWAALDDAAAAAAAGGGDSSMSSGDEEGWRRLRSGTDGAVARRPGRERADGLGSGDANSRCVSSSSGSSSLSAAAAAAAARRRRPVSDFVTSGCSSTTRRGKQQSSVSEGWCSRDTEGRCLHRSPRRPPPAGRLQRDRSAGHPRWGRTADGFIFQTGWNRRGLRPAVSVDADHPRSASHRS